MSWDYRIIRTEQGGEEIFSVHEVYYNDKGPPMWTEDPAQVLSDSAEGVKNILAMMEKAFERPIFQVIGNSLMEWKPK